MRAPGTPGALDALLALARALAAGRRVRIRYEDAAGAPTSRRVSPLALGFRSGHWLLAAHCHLRHAFRHFRVDRVAAVRPAPGRAASRLAPPGFDPRFFSAEGYLAAGRAPAALATVRLAPPLAGLAGVLFPAALRERREGGVLCHLRASDGPALSALVASLGAAAALGYTERLPWPPAPPPRQGS